MHQHLGQQKVAAWSSKWTIRAAVAALPCSVYIHDSGSGKRYVLEQAGPSGVKGNAAITGGRSGVPRKQEWALQPRMHWQNIRYTKYVCCRESEPCI